MVEDAEGRAELLVATVKPSASAEDPKLLNSPADACRHTETCRKQAAVEKQHTQTAGGTQFSNVLSLTQIVSYRVTRPETTSTT